MLESRILGPAPTENRPNLAKFYTNQLLRGTFLPAVWGRKEKINTLLNTLLSWLR